MMHVEQKSRAEARLSRIEGQVRGIRKMVQEDRYCIDILAQTAAVVSALRGVEDLIMSQHLKTCVVDAMRSNDGQDKELKIEEVLSVISKFRKHG
jgi:DNA-binding FrmR family transcriptional regulator